MEALPVSGLCGLRLMFRAHLFNFPFSIFFQDLVSPSWCLNKKYAINRVSQQQQPFIREQPLCKEQSAGKPLGETSRDPQAFLCGVAGGVLPFRQGVNALAHALLEPALIRMPGSSILWDVKPALSSREQMGEKEGEQHGKEREKGKRGKERKKERSRSDHSKPTRTISKI